MTTKRPIELVNASIALSELWSRYDEAVERQDKVTMFALGVAVEYLTERYNTLYQEWQILGGTSDIRSIALCGIGEIPAPAQLAHTSRERDPQDEVYDFTPCEDMPVIDFDNIKEIPFS